MLFSYFFNGIKRFFSLIFAVLGFEVKNKNIIKLEDNALRGFFWTTFLLINATLIQSIIFVNIEGNNVVLLVFLILTIGYPPVFFALLFFAGQKQEAI